MKTDSRFSKHEPLAKHDSIPGWAATGSHHLADENCLALVLSTIALCVGGISLLEVPLDMALALTPASFLLTLVRKSALLVAGLVVVLNGRLTCPTLVLGFSMGALVSVVASFEIASLTGMQAALLVAEVPLKLALVGLCVKMTFRQNRPIGVSGFH